MPKINENEIPERGWSDVCVRAIAWTGEGRDLALSVRFPEDVPSGEREMTLHCRWASNLRVELGFKENEAGFPLTSEVSFNRTAAGWSIEFDFAGAGRILLHCADMELAPTDPSACG